MVNFLFNRKLVNIVEIYCYSSTKALNENNLYFFREFDYAILVDIHPFSKCAHLILGGPKTGRGTLSLDPNRHSFTKISWSVSKLLTFADPLEQY